MWYAGRMYCHIDIPYVPFFVLYQVSFAQCNLRTSLFFCPLRTYFIPSHFSLARSVFPSRSFHFKTLSHAFSVAPKRAFALQRRKCPWTFPISPGPRKFRMPNFIFFPLLLVSRLRIYSFPLLYSFAAKRRPVPDRRHLLPVLRLPHRALHLLHRQVLRGGVHIPCVKGRRRHQIPKKRKDLSKSRYFEQPSHPYP